MVLPVTLHFIILLTRTGNIGRWLRASHGLLRRVHHGWPVVACGRDSFPLSPSDRCRVGQMKLGEIKEVAMALDAEIKVRTGSEARLTAPPDLLALPHMLAGTN